MREIGLGPRGAEVREPVGDAIRSTIKYLSERTPNESVDFAILLSKECTKIVLSLMLGDDVSEDLAEKINEAYLKMLLPMGDINVLLVGSIAKFFILPFIRGYSRMKEGKKDMLHSLRAIVDERKKSLDYLKPPKNLIDSYLKEKALKESRGDPHAKYFTDDYLISMLILAYGDGSVGIALFVVSFLKDLSSHRDSQDAIYEEISRVIGTERFPTWEDRQQLPLTVSAIKELFRITKFFPVYPSLECVEDTNVLGVPAPKGCITLVNNWAVHHDGAIYKNPDHFDITRFLPGDSKEDDPVSFGLGRRACAGESLVMMETFLFLTALLQKFIFLPHENKMNSKDSSPYEDATQSHLRIIARHCSS